MEYTRTLNLNFFLLVATSVLVLFAGLYVSTVEGLECPICYRIGPFGSEDCDFMMPCNDQADLKVAHQVMEVLKEHVWQNLRSNDRNTTKKDFKPSKSPPVCAKVLGYITPEGKSESYPYVDAKCGSRDENRPTPNPCDIRLAPQNDFSAYMPEGVSLTIDKFCVCDKEENEENCKVEEGDPTGQTVDLIRDMGPLAVVQQRLLEKDHQLKYHQDF